MKQLSLATLMYTQDNDGRLPFDITREGLSVFEPLMPYIKSRQVRYCPSAPNPTAPDSDGWAAEQYGYPNATGSRAKGYKVVAAFMGQNSGGAYITGSVALDSIPRPSRTCMLGETVYKTPTNTNYLKYGWGRPYFYVTGGNLIRDRHLGGSNYAYLDGHVKWVKKEVVDAMLAEVAAEKSVTGAGGYTVNRNGYGLVESLGKWQEFPIVFGWAVE